MSYRDMQFELKGWCEKLALPFAQTIVNEALRVIYEENLWSFQLGESGWLTPGLLGTGGTLSPGTVTLTQGSATVVGDATALAAWTALGLSKLKTQQFRSAAYALYNVINFVSPNLTLDRPWMEPVVGAGRPYMMYQCYFPAPVANFKRFLTVRDFQNAIDLGLDKTQAYLATRDPQRQVFANCYEVVPYQVDSRPGSATLGYMLYELWPHNLSITPYSTYYASMGTMLLNPGDNVPWPLVDDLVKTKARVKGYEWKMSQTGEDTKRGSGANWQFLMEAAELQYKDRLQQIRKLDRDMVDSFLSKIRRVPVNVEAGFYSGITRQANVGSF